MARIIRPWQVLVVATAGWISREQDSVIEYLREENRVLKQQLGGRRLRLTDAQRRRLEAKGKAIGYRVLSEVASIVTPHRRGVGPMTITMLLANTVAAYEARLRTPTVGISIPNSLHETLRQLENHQNQ